MLAALVLGYYSYRFAAELAQRSEASVESSTRALGLKLLDRIEQVIIDGGRTFFRLVSVEDPREFRELWRRIVRVSPAVESVTVLGADRRLVHLVAKLDPAALDDFRRRILRRMLPDLELDRLAIDHHKHLYRRYDGRAYLVSYIRQQAGGRDFFLVLNMNLQYLVGEVFPREFRELEATNALSVIDEESPAPVYGRPLQLASPLVFEGVFPTTLYKWRLQVAPLQLGPLHRGARARRLSALLLVGGAIAVIWLGLAVILIAVRKERRANALKSDFIANVSHELKTPLSLIRMFGELLALGRGKDPKTTREYAEIIMRESDRLSGQIDNVLDFARIERGKDAYTMRTGDLRGVVERAVELCRYRAEQAQVRLELAVPDDPVVVVFDESAMTLLVLNLVENALKYAAEPGSVIRVLVVRQAEQVRLRVVDAGPGLTAEEQRRVFERFYRGERARQGPQRGSGIGLSLVKHIAQAHGGRASVQSELGKGATFEVSLPAAGEEPG